MKPSLAANVALALVVIGWLFTFYGAFSQLGHPDPKISSSVIETALLKSRLILLTGVIALFVSVWLAGYAFTQARWRSLVSALSVVLPTIAIYANTFLRHIAL